MTRNQRKPDLHLRDRALKAHRLARKNITGEELAARLKTGVEAAHDLARVGGLIARAEAMRLNQREWDGMKVIARVIARNVMLGRDWAKTSGIDFVAGKRSGWCARIVVDLAALGLVQMPMPGRLTLTNAGWAFVWEAGLVKRNWRVPL